MGLLSSLFSTEAIAGNASKIVDAGISGIDSLVLTDEERINYSKNFIDAKIDFLKATEPYKLAQRYLAFFIIINFFLAFWVGVVTYFAFPEYLDGFIHLVGVFELGWITLAVVMFYFKPEAVSSLLNRNKK